MDKKTPLYENHVALGGKMVPFGGYLMPVQYSGILAEHMAVRTRAGLFDVSHMGEVIYEGAGALAALNRLLTNDFTNLAIGRVRYSVMCGEDGGCLDDLIVYRLAEEKYLVVVNAANHDRDVAHMREELPERGVIFTDVSEETGLVALQGPASKEILEKLAPADTLPEKYYSVAQGVTLCGVECLVSRTGYTGEFGYEIFTPAEKTAAIWDALLAAGKDEGLVPCGLGARDTLRLEAAMPLYGHEMNETVSPLETGLGFGVKMNKETFIGKTGIEARGTSRERIGLKVTGRGIVREHEPVTFAGEEIGMTTSGTFCPYLKGAYAMALIAKGKVKIGDTVEADVRGRKVAAEVVALPFYKR